LSYGSFAALLHPLMAGYAAIAMLTLALVDRNAWRSVPCFTGWDLALCGHFLGHAA